jgi:SAM-dependent methyltransferase
MTGKPAVENRWSMKGSDICAYDLPTQDKIPVVRQLIRAHGRGLALDIGSGTGYTTRRVFGDRPTVCLDLHAATLRHARATMASTPDAFPRLYVVGEATALPFKPGVFRFVLCSEVLEHLEDDDVAVRELSRVLASDGRAVITVPHTGLGFTSFLDLLGVKTVHDFPGPEYHVRPGYDERSLLRLLARHGLYAERRGYYLRFFTRVVTDVVGAAHLLYQRLVHGRRAWTWAEAALSDGGLAFRLYTRVFPVLRASCRLDRALGRTRGFGLIVSAGKRAGEGRAFP